MIRFIVALGLLLLTAWPAQAQRPCDMWAFITDVPASDTAEIVPRIANTRVYICGYTATGSAEFQIVSGLRELAGPNCAIDTTQITPVLKMPPDGILINRIPFVAEFTPISHALCVRRPSQSGELSITVYYTQF